MQIDTQKKVKVTKRIICLNDNKEFKSPASAARCYSLSLPHLTKVARGHGVYKGRLAVDGKPFRFAYIDEEGKPVLTPKHLESPTIEYKYKVTNIETLEELYFTTYKKMHEKIKLSSRQIINYFNGRDHEDISPYKIEILKQNGKNNE